MASQLSPPTHVHVNYNQELMCVAKQHKEASNSCARIMAYNTLPYMDITAKCLHIYGFGPSREKCFKYIKNKVREEHVYGHVTFGRQCLRTQR